MRWFRMAALLVGALTAACPVAAQTGAAKAGAAKAGAAKDQLTIGLNQYPSNLHPNIESMLAKNYVLAMTRRPFTTFDAEWRLVCQLCVELPSLENGLAAIEDAPAGPDGKPRKGIRTTYQIQPGATWGDGTPVTTRDVLFTWEVGRHPQSGISNAELYRRLIRVEAVDDRTFTMHWDKISFDYAGINDFQLLPAHLERPVFEADPANYRNRTLFDTDPTNKGLGFGPYRIVEVAVGSHLVLEPNPTWYGPKPFFKRIIVKAIENSAALEANLLSGSIDMIAGELGVSLDQALAFEKRHGDRYAVVYKPGLIYEHIDLNLDNPILADRRVRQALLLGVDRRTISRQLFDDKQPVADSFVNGLDWIHSTDVNQYPFDPKRAAALLDEAGWRQAGRGAVRQNAAGDKLSLELMTTAGNRSRETIQQVLQNQWRQLGIEIRVRNEPPRVFFGETVSKRKFTGMALFAWVSSPENVPRSTLHSTEIPSAENRWAGQNSAGFRSPEIDRLIDDVEIELDREQRRILWHRIQSIYTQELPALPLFFRADAYILPKWLKGVVPTGHQYTSTQAIEQWRAEP